MGKTMDKNMVAEATTPGIENRGFLI